LTLNDAQIDFNNTQFV